jgi:hypothetical protein
MLYPSLQSSADINNVLSLTSTIYRKHNSVLSGDFTFIIYKCRLHLAATLVGGFE